jgi:N-acetylmuramoyl-L-alanine amidase
VSGAALLGGALLLVLAARAGRLTQALAGGAAPPASPTAAAAGTPHSEIHVGLPTLTPVSLPAGVTPTAPPAIPSNRVALIAGHWQYDTGAVCPDGRMEVEVTTDVAARAKAILEARGYDVEILPEHDPDVPGPPLQGYRAAALVSIHADSCEVSPATGFKVARWLYSNLPQADDRLVGCLYDEYAAATGLPRHDDSITINMTNYYAFREIGLETPAAILELGFLLDDRATLDGKRYEMALGIADGIGCFLDG